MNDTAERFRRVAAGMTETVAAVPDDAWDNPSPCEGWSTRGVLCHLVEWIPGPGFLLGAYGIDIGPVPSLDSDPVGAWSAVRDGVQAGLDDPTVAERVEDCGPLGRLSFAAAVDTTCTPDVLIHTWDIAQAAGIDVVLDPEAIERQAEGLESVPAEVDAAMRGSGMFGPWLEVAPDADPTTKVLAFYGRQVRPHS